MANRKDTTPSVVEASGFMFEISEPPAANNERRGKHDPMWDAAREAAIANPGRSLLVTSWGSPSSPTNYAKAINNKEHRKFEDEGWLAIAAPMPDQSGTYGLWLKYEAK